MRKNSVWDRRAVYSVIGIKPENHIPPAMTATFLYAGLILSVVPSTGGAHRVIVTCSCSKRVPFGRMEQHLRAARHKGDAPIAATPQSLALDAEFEARCREMDERRAHRFALA